MVPLRDLPGEAARRLNAWFATPLGGAVLEAEQALCDRVLPTLFGYQLLELSAWSGAPLHSESRINLRMRCAPGGVHGEFDLHADFDFLPFAEESIDVLVLHHALEIVDNPHQVLRECARVLAPHGHLVIVGLNPWSPLGMVEALLRRLGRGVGLLRVISAGRMHDWLELLDLEAITSLRAFYGWPSQRLAARQMRAKWQRAACARCLPFNGITVTVARKRVAAVTPLRKLWTKRAVMLPAQINPAVRSGPAR